MIAAEIRIEPMSQVEAERETQCILSNFQDSRRRIKNFDDRQGWKALGYSSFTAWAKERFSDSAARAIQCLQAEKILEHIRIGSLTTVNEDSLMDVPEGALRPMARLLKMDDAGEKIREAWDAAIEDAGGRPTAAQVKAVVDEKFPRAHRPRAGAPEENRGGSCVEDGPVVAEHPKVAWRGTGDAEPPPQMPDAELEAGAEDFVSPSGYFDPRRAIEPVCRSARELMRKLPEEYHFAMITALEAFVETLVVESGMRGGHQDVDLGGDDGE